MFRLIVRWYNPFYRRVQDNVFCPDIDEIHTDGSIMLSKCSGYIVVIGACDILALIPHKF